jgi:hypothetical protein
MLQGIWIASVPDTPTSIMSLTQQAQISPRFLEQTHLCAGFPLIQTETASWYWASLGKDFEPRDEIYLAGKVPSLVPPHF